jgi:hypothetical protein
MVTEPASNDRVVHNWLVGLFFKIRLPALSEVRSWPGFELFEFRLGWSDLDSGLDSIGGKWSSALKIPLVIYLWFQSAHSHDEAQGFLLFCTSGTPLTKSSKLSVSGLAR